MKGATRRQLVKQGKKLNNREAPVQTLESQRMLHGQISEEAEAGPGLRNGSLGRTLRGETDLPRTQSM